jgi:hypothetical protein
LRDHIGTLYSDPEFTTLFPVKRRSPRILMVKGTREIGIIIKLGTTLAELESVAETGQPCLKSKTPPQADGV